MIRHSNHHAQVRISLNHSQNPMALTEMATMILMVHEFTFINFDSLARPTLCFLKSSVNAAVYQDILEYFMVPAADQLFGDNEFIFQQDLAPPHSAKSTQAWCENCHVHVLDWPANSPHLNPIENLWGIVKKKLHKTSTKYF